MECHDVSQTHIKIIVPHTNAYFFGQASLDQPTRSDNISAKAAQIVQGVRRQNRADDAAAPLNQPNTPGRQKQQLY